jgi:competence protein ComEC
LLRHPRATCRPRPALSFIAGIAFGLWSGSGVPAWSARAVRRSSSAFAHSVRDPRLLLAAVCTGWAAAGALLAIDADAIARDPPLRRWLPDDDAALVVEGRLWEDAVSTPSGVALVVDIDRVVRGGESFHVRGRALLSMTGDTGAAPVPEWRAGRRLRAPAWLRAPTHYRNPGGPDHRLALARRGVAVVGSIKSATLVDVIAKGGPIDEAGAAVRAGVRRLVARSIAPWSERSAAITTAILIGDRAGLDDAVTRALQEAGTYHVIAISGGNVAILAGCLLAGGRLLRLPWRANFGAAATVLVGYAHLASGGSSVTRATTMAVVYLAARMLDQRGSAAGSLGIAATLILCGAPLSLVEPGFLLTFGATTAMLVLVPAVAASVRQGWLRAPATLLAASVASELALMPVGAVFFSRVTLAGLLLNFAAVPLMTVVQVGGMAALGVAVLAPSTAVLVGWVPHAAAEGLVVSADFVRWVPWLAWRVAPPPAWALACYYGALASTTGLVLVWPRWPRRVARRLAAASAGAFALSAGCILWAPALGAREPRAVRVVVLDVGQGDASVVEVNGGRTMVIDAGGLAGTARFDIGERVVAPALWARGIRALDALVITHGDADHVGGAPALLELFPTREIWEGVPVPAHEPLALLASAAERRGVPGGPCRTATACVSARSRSTCCTRRGPTGNASASGTTTR